MSGILCAVAAGARNLFRVTIGGTDPYGFIDASFGSILPTTFADHGANTQTVKALAYNTGSGALAFRLNGAAVANTDTTFVAILVNGVRLTRASAVYAAGTPAGQSQWTWTPGSNIVGTSGVASLRVE